MEVVGVLSKSVRSARALCGTLNQQPHIKISTGPLRAPGYKISAKSVYVINMLPASCGQDWIEWYRLLQDVGVTKDIGQILVLIQENAVCNLFHPFPAGRLPISIWCQLRTCTICSICPYLSTMLKPEEHPDHFVLGNQ